LGVSAVVFGASALEVRVDLLLLPVGTEEPADAEHGDADHRHDDAGAEYGPVEPEIVGAGEQVDGEPEQAEGQIDDQDRVEPSLRCT
jgi:hypothetical protein